MSLLSLFRPEAVADKRRKLHGALLLSRPLGGVLLTWTLAGLAALAIVYLFSYDFHRKESVRGYVTSSGGVITLRARNAGVLSALFVEAGDRVGAGDPLFEAATDIDTGDGPLRRGQLRTTEDRIRQIDEQSALVAASFGERRRFLGGQLERLDNRIRQMDARLAARRRLLDIGEQNLERMTRLNERRYASEAEVSRRLEDVLLQRAAVAEAASDISAARAERDRLRFELESLPAERSRALSELAIRGGVLQQSRLEQTAQQSHVVRAPVDGRITAVHGEVGQTVAAQAGVVRLVPEDTAIVANLLAPSRAIGFLEEGGPVHLRIDAFPYQKFGLQSGRILEVSRTAFQPGELKTPFPYDEAAYRVVVELDRDHVYAYGRRYPLQVDMTLRGDLVVDRRSLLEWILEPVLALRP